MNILDFLLSNDSLRSLFAQVFISMILSIYEFSMFYFTVVPSVNQQAINSINNVVSQLKSTLEQQFIPTQLQSPIIQNALLDKVLQNPDLQNIDQQINAVFFTLKERELQKINKINTYTKITGSLIIGISLIIMFIIWLILQKRNQNIGICTWYTIILSLILVGAFQYLFYLYGNKYNYIGSTGQHELVAFLYDHTFDKK